MVNDSDGIHLVWQRWHHVFSDGSSTPESSQSLLYLLIFWYSPLSLLTMASHDDEDDYVLNMNIDDTVTHSAEPQMDSDYTEIVGPQDTEAVDALPSSPSATGVAVEGDEEGSSAPASVTRLSSPGETSVSHTSDKDVHRILVPRTSLSSALNLAKAFGEDYCFRYDIDARHSTLNAKDLFAASRELIEELRQEKAELEAENNDLRGGAAVVLRDEVEDMRRLLAGLGLVCHPAPLHLRSMRFLASRTNGFHAGGRETRQLFEEVAVGWFGSPSSMGSWY